ncbi:MAG: hypothetical protein JWN40_1380 [Phycisphaerales bacterium]|jgi:hypothetical protein|nr:hypothetical protein [Phycisphaerales bacterium]
MNPATLHPDHLEQHDRDSSSTADNLNVDRLTPASHSYLEPQGEGILFAAFCLISSLIIYCGVLLIRFLG